MQRQINIISPTRAVHADNPEESGKQAMCGQYGSSRWVSTDKPVTCKTCLRVQESIRMKKQPKPTQMDVVKACVKFIDVMTKVCAAEVERFNKTVSKLCDYNDGSLILTPFGDGKVCNHEDNDIHCCIAGCPLWKEEVT